MKKLLLILAMFPLFAFSQNLTQAEYFFDTDPGYGNGIKMNFQAAQTVNLDANIYTGQLSQGLHTLYYRFKDDVFGWGQTFNQKIFINEPKRNLVQAEYFFDEDPGLGRGIKMNFGAKNAVTLSANLYTALLSPGLHTFYYRFKGDTHGWGQTFKQTVFINEPKRNLLQCEYFFDEDPGYGHGIKMNFTAGDTVNLVANLALKMVEPGFRTLYYRFKTEKGWGGTYAKNLFKPSVPGIARIVYAFDDSDEKNTIELANPLHAINDHFALDISALSAGAHTLHLWVQNINGYVSNKVSMEFNASVDMQEAKGLEPFRAFPNPASSFIEFSGDRLADEVLICNMQGAVIMKLAGSIARVDVSNLNEGTYLLLVKSQQKIGVELIVIRR